MLFSDLIIPLAVLFVPIAVAVIVFRLIWLRPADNESPSEQPPEEGRMVWLQKDLLP